VKLGIVLPQELRDRVALRDFVQGIDELGFDHLVFPDHVIGGNPATHPINGPYTHESFFHELSVTMGFAAALTERIELVAGVMILPQRQAALAAKQMAEVDVLSGGRVRLGVGVGWNQVEFDVLGMEFNNRGRRIEEQIEVLRAMWRNPLVDFDGRWHHIVDAGINPLPLRRTIPIWFGGWSDPAVKRLARMGDGWLLYAPLEEVGRERLDALDKACEVAGRNRREIGIESWIFLNHSDVMAGANQKPGADQLRTPEEWAREGAAWKAAGATHMDCWTMYGGLTRPEQHLRLAKQFKEVMDVL
jgi:probable F420-dependent oxidoreductase